MKKSIFLLVTICVSTAFTMKGCLYYPKLTARLIQQRNYFLSRAYSTETGTNIKKHRYVLTNKEPGIKENPAYPFKDFILLNQPMPEILPKTPLEKILIRKNNALDRSFERALQDELDRINEKNNE